MSARTMPRGTTSDYLGPIRYPYALPPHVAPHPYRMEEGPRKRPKYTRSKTGCLTCRAKKVKCDEARPICTRCAHGQRECTWPAPRQAVIRTCDTTESADSRSSTTSSPSVSEPPTPPTKAKGPPPRRQAAIASNVVPRQPPRTSVDGALPIASATTSARVPAIPAQDGVSHGVSDVRSSARAAEVGHRLPQYSAMSDYGPYMNHASGAPYSFTAGAAANEDMLYAPSSHVAPYYGLPHLDMPPDLGRSPLAASWEGSFDAAVQGAVSTKPYDLYHPIPVHASRRFAVNPYSSSEYQY